MRAIRTTALVALAAGAVVACGGSADTGEVEPERRLVEESVTLVPANPEDGDLLGPRGLPDGREVPLETRLRNDSLLRAAMAEARADPRWRVPTPPRARRLA